jgi:hypothetical protein
MSQENYIDVIITIDDYEQLFITINDVDDLDENTFLYQCFDEIANENKELLYKLIKLSCCQYNCDENNIKPYLLDRNGKYFFNLSINKDEDTKRNVRILSEYIKTH